jgi:hypothetical protein
LGCNSGKQGRVLLADVKEKIGSWVFFSFLDQSLLFPTHLVHLRDALKSHSATMKAVVSTLALLVATVLAQERCDAAEPKVFCNTTEILAYQTSDCRPYHIFLARGSDEPYPGRQGNLTRDICSRIGSNDCGFENIEYPAKSSGWGPGEWCKSASAGAANGQAQMKAYNQRCPDSKLILLGYSQGGAVAQNILSGGGGYVFECDLPSNPALDMSIGSKSEEAPVETKFPHANEFKSLQQ